MISWKLLTYINWLLIVVCTFNVLYCLIVINGATSITGRNLEFASKGLCVLGLLVLIGLNLLPYRWNKIAALLLGTVAVLLFGYTITR